MFDHERFSFPHLLMLSLLESCLCPVGVLVFKPKILMKCCCLHTYTRRATARAQKHTQHARRMTAPDQQTMHGGSRNAHEKDPGRHVHMPSICFRFCLQIRRITYVASPLTPRTGTPNDDLRSEALLLFLQRTRRIHPS